jgi:hypothetical protein
VASKIDDRVTAWGATFLCFASALLGAAVGCALSSPIELANLLSNAPLELGNAAEWLAAAGACLAVVITALVAYRQHAWQEEQREERGKIAIRLMAHELAAAARVLVYIADFAKRSQDAGKLIPAKIAVEFLAATELPVTRSERSNYVDLPKPMPGLAAIALDEIDRARRGIRFCSNWIDFAVIAPAFLEQAKEALVPFAEAARLQIHGTAPDFAEWAKGRRENSREEMVDPADLLAVQAQCK